MDELLGLVTAKAQEWLGSSFDEKTREEVKALMAKDDKSDLIDAFYKDLVQDFALKLESTNQLQLAFFVTPSVK